MEKLLNSAMLYIVVISIILYQIEVPFEIIGFGVIAGLLYYGLYLLSDIRDKLSEIAKENGKQRELIEGDNNENQ